MRIKNIEIENIIWAIYFIVIMLALISNYYEKNSIVDSDYSEGLISKNINIFVFIVLLIIYIYFLDNSYEQYVNSPTNVNYTSLVGNVFNVIGGVIFLYVAINAGVGNNIEM